jgi:hypothetical protein
MNQQDVDRILTVIKARYGPKFRYDRMTTTAWHMVLDDVPYEETMIVLRDLMKQEEWAPDPATLRNTVLDTTSGLPTPSEAWQMVQQRIRNTYPGMPAEAWDAPQPIQDAAKDVGGIYLIRQAEKPEAMRQRFEDAYRRRRDEVRAARSEMKAIDIVRKQVKELT